MEKKVVTYSRNVFIPVTNICRNRCDYCGFRREPVEGWLMEPEQIAELAKKASEAGCAEALITLGERPEIHPIYRQKLLDLGYETTVDYLEDICRRLLEAGLLPHTNAGVITDEEMGRLRRYSASMGLMLECAVDLTVHRKSPGKRPEVRLEVIRKAGELRIPFTTGLLVGIGESREDRLVSLMKIREIQEEFGHIQEVIIQPFAPKPGTPMAGCPPPPISEVLWTVRMAREVLPDLGVQVPPNLIGDLQASLPPLLGAGANDLGGISPVTPDFINPEHPWPAIGELKSVVERLGFRMRERLPIYPIFVKDGRFMSEEVKRVVRRLSDEDGYRRV